MATFNQVQLSNSTLKSKTVHKSKLTKCTLIRITFHNSSITDSILKNCSMYDSIIHTSKLYNCKIYGTQGMLRSQPTLSKFPAEIREIIFELCLAETWTGKTPSLVIALRCQKELYSQALEVFQKMNRFFLRDANRLVLFKSMPETVLSNIRSITIANLFM
ncbi:hypothetical protein L207DRAFT_532400 [Hyaloscypha variabilis F]|uniref:Uncharacterized protein n=1 Tax=Hyaloscypha variabilis (strain UAMH 11265 / GT02V1 / F) TaxID=1149755 RepID=A0A2J6RE68_HYAVF|nr:hypothetical protein L207DRAFT_532400 [Hyaloscypha variabilis F]